MPEPTNQTYFLTRFGDLLGVKGGDTQSELLGVPAIPIRQRSLPRNMNLEFVVVPHRICHIANRRKNPCELPDFSGCARLWVDGRVSRTPPT